MNGMGVPYRCERCDTANVASAYASYAKPRPDRCTRCGAVHSVLGTDVSVISPRCVGIPREGSWRASPWHLPWHRPAEEGHYECRFTNTEPRILTLWWNGRAFVVPDGRRVNMATFLTWRGRWDE
jgi:hypothetical protein